MVIVLVKKTTSSILRVNVTSQSDFPVKVKGHTEIGRKMDTDTDKQYFHRHHSKIWSGTKMG